jgi:putative acetyltransferase
MERWLRKDAFEGQTCIVTGAAQGIGLSVAHGFAAHGAQVAVVDLDAGRVKAACDEIAAAGGPSPLALHAKVSDEEQLRRAVAATHDFVSAEDRVAIDRIVGEDYLPNADLLLAVDEQDRPLAFLGANGTEIESLFVDPALHGQGVGTLLVEEFARGAEAALTVEVNEQNLGARRFYERRGFRVTGRLDHDRDGRPYPLLLLARQEGCV